MSPQEDRLRQSEGRIRDKLLEMGLDLHGLKYFRAGRHSILRVFVDKEGGATVADCEQASNAISILLDVESFSEGPYTLEVSTPGLDAPLENRRDFLRHRGRMVAVNLKEPVDGKSVITGSVDECTDDILTIRDSDEIIGIPFSNIKNGKAVVQFK